MNRFFISFSNKNNQPLLIVPCGRAKLHNLVNFWFEPCLEWSANLRQHGCAKKVQRPGLPLPTRCHSPAWAICKSRSTSCRVGCSNPPPDSLTGHSLLMHRAKFPHFINLHSPGGSSPYHVRTMFVPCSKFYERGTNTIGNKLCFVGRLEPKKNFLIARLILLPSTPFVFGSGKP